MSERLRRVNSLLQQEVGLIINRDLQNSKMQFVTVLRADISCDLRSGRIFVSILCKDKKDIDEIVEYLNQSAGYVQKLLGKRVRLRYMPKLRFIYDDIIEHRIRVQKVLDKIKREDSSPLESGDSK